jgi:hypothetical protein
MLRKNTQFVDYFSPVICGRNLTVALLVTSVTERLVVLSTNGKIFCLFSSYGSDLQAILQKLSGSSMPFHRNMAICCSVNAQGLAAPPMTTDLNC